MSRGPPPTPTRGPRCATTGHEPPWTGTPPMWSPPTSLARHAESSGWPQPRPAGQCLPGRAAGVNGDPGHGGGSEQAASATPGPGRHQVSYTHNMAGRGLHKEIRKAIAAAGLDPAGAEGPHPALAHLAIDTASLPAAIIAAVRQIERLGIAVTGVQSTDLVSLRDIAARTGRSYESVRKLAHGQRGPGGFPAPLSTGQWALYSWAEISR